MDGDDKMAEHQRLAATALALFASTAAANDDRPPKNPIPPEAWPAMEPPSAAKMSVPQPLLPQANIPSESQVAQKELEDCMMMLEIDTSRRITAGDTATFMASNNKQAVVSPDALCDHDSGEAEHPMAERSEQSLAPRQLWASVPEHVVSTTKRQSGNDIHIDVRVLVTVAVDGKPLTRSSSKLETKVARHELTLLEADGKPIADKLKEESTVGDDNEQISGECGSRLHTSGRRGRIPMRVCKSPTRRSLRIQKRRASHANAIPDRMSEADGKPRAAEESTHGDVIDLRNPGNSKRGSRRHSSGSGRPQKRVCKSPTRRSTRIQERRASQANQATEDAEPELEILDVVAVMEAEGEPQALKPEDDSIVDDYMELNYSLSREFDRSLRSKECAHGADCFRRAIVFHHMYPDRESRRKLIDMLVNGPVGHMKHARFPDKAHTIAGMSVIKQLLEEPGMHAMLAQDVVDFGWVNFFGAVTDPLFCASGDESRTNHDAFTRIGDSLYVKASGMELLAQLLEYEQQRCRPTRDDLTAKPLVSEIALECRSALDLCVKAFWHVLIHQGAFLTQNTSYLCELPGGPTYDCMDRINSPLERLVTSMGKVLSILVWVYAIVESESMLSLSDRIGSTISQAIELSTFDPAHLLDEADSQTEFYWDNIKIRFLISLDPSVVPQLRPHLATKLSVASIYNCIFG